MTGSKDPGLTGLGLDGTEHGWGQVGTVKDQAPRSKCGKDEAGRICHYVPFDLEYLVGTLSELLSVITKNHGSLL